MGMGCLTLHVGGISYVQESFGVLGWDFFMFNLIDVCGPEARHSDSGRKIL